jgi:hypothetical protein
MVGVWLMVVVLNNARYGFEHRCSSLPRLTAFADQICASAEIQHVHPVMQRNVRQD